jgi:hypothetical protein
MAFIKDMIWGKTLSPQDAEEWLFRNGLYKMNHEGKDLDAAAHFPKLKSLSAEEQRKGIIKIYKEHLVDRYLKDEKGDTGIGIVEVLKEDKPELDGEMDIEVRKKIAQAWQNEQLAKKAPKEKEKEKDKKSKKDAIPKSVTVTGTATTTSTSTTPESTLAQLPRPRPRASTGTVNFINEMRKDTLKQIQELDEEFEVVPIAEVALADTVTTTTTTTTTTTSTATTTPATSSTPSTNNPLVSSPSSISSSTTTTTTTHSTTPVPAFQFYSPAQFAPPLSSEMYPVIAMTVPQYVPKGEYGEFFEIIDEPKAKKGWLWSGGGKEAVRVRKIDTRKIENKLIDRIKDKNNLANAVQAYGNAILKKAPTSYDSYKEQIAFFEQAVDAALSITGKHAMVEGALREQFYRGFLTAASEGLKNLLANPDEDATPMINAFLEAKKDLLNFHKSKLAQSSKLSHITTEMTPEMELVEDLKMNQSQFIMVLEQIRHAYLLANLPAQKNEDLIKTHLSRWRQWAWAFDALEFPQVPKNLHKSKAPVDLTQLNSQMTLAPVQSALPSAPPSAPLFEPSEFAPLAQMQTYSMPPIQSFIPEISYDAFPEINDKPVVKKGWISSGIPKPKVDTKAIEEALREAIQENQNIDQAMGNYCQEIQTLAPKNPREKISYFEQAVAKAVKIVAKKDKDVESKARAQFYCLFIQDAAQELRSVLIDYHDEDATPLINAFLEAKSDLLNLLKNTPTQSPELALVTEMKLQFSLIIPLEQIRAAYLLARGKDKDQNMANTHLSRWKQWAWVCQTFKIPGIPNNLHKKTRPVDFSQLDTTDSAKAVTEKSVLEAGASSETSTRSRKKEKKSAVSYASPYKKSYIDARFDPEIQEDELQAEAVQFYGIRYRLLKMALTNHSLATKLVTSELTANHEFDVNRELTRMETEGVHPMLEAADETLEPILRAAYKVVILLEGNASNEQLFKAIKEAPDELFAEPAFKKYLTRQARAEGFEAMTINAGKPLYTPIIAQAVMAWFDSRITAYANYAELN